MLRLLYVKVKSSIIVFFVVWFGYLQLSLAGQSPSYGAYGLFPTGSTRVLAMGGAFVGLADDASAVQFNPAGLALTENRFSLSAVDNRVVSKEADLNYDTNHYPDATPYSILQDSVAFRFGPFGVGGALSTIYNFNYQPDIFYREYKILRIESTEAAFAFAVGKNLAFGVTVHNEKAKMSFQNQDGTTPTSSASKNYLSYGILYKVPKASFGISYRPERRFDIDESLESQVAPAVGLGYAYFYDVVIPGRTSIGASVEIAQNLIGVGDIDFYQSVENAFVMGGKVETDEVIDSEHRILKKDLRLIHGGFEYEVSNNKDFGFKWRGGGYIEPPRVKAYSSSCNGGAACLVDKSSRFHYTMGIEFRVRYIVFSAAYDQAADFNNVAQSVSATF